ncbi:hypothetical protein KUTeg_022714 [Tegillarca granosa]|uniref:Death domain-containing protein n=1 Tax=Tegillarca granosa TaxID=220873 RepID=A0ABQ9DZF6_TEGGR|nr:hypothetical protein KUTeg_022714 [Tegillarca granosa]
MMDDIPFSCVSVMTWQSLANKLDPDCPLMGNNWKMLAEKLGYNTEQILCLESRHTSHGRNTIKLFEEYLNKRDSTVKKLQKALEDMDRPDALQVLLDSMPDIEQQYQRELNSQRIKSDPDENSYRWSACQSSCSGFLNGRIPTPNQTYMSQHHSYHNQMSTHAYSSAMQSQAYMPSISHIAMAGGSIHHMPEKELNIPQNHNCGPTLNTGNHYRVSSNHHSRVEHPQKSRIPNANPSMVVNVDQQDMVGSIRDIEMTPEYNIPVTEDPAPLPLAISRGQNINVPRLMNPQDMLIGREVTVTSTSPQPQASHPFQTRYERQVSEECNSRQPANVNNRSKNNNIGLNLPCSNAQSIQQEGIEFISPGPTPTSVPSTPLDKLKQFTDSESYMPTQQYKTMMEEKLREEVLYNRAYNDETHNKLRAELQNKKNNEVTNEDAFRSIFKFNRSSHHSALNQKIQQCTSSSTSTSGKTGVDKDVPKTFPLRAFRHIKVFVTYSDEKKNKKHLQRVLNLCRCLERNGFTCCMDMYGRNMTMTDKVGWLDQRFREADFILVCVSEGYKSDTDNYETEMSAEFSDDALHTKYLYKLMQAEYQDNGQRNLRFIPLLFENSEKEQIPTWLDNGLQYQWPGQYRDLLWFLTKPETRVKDRDKSNIDENSPSSPEATLNI